MSKLDELKKDREEIVEGTMCRSDHCEIIHRYAPYQGFGMKAHQEALKKIDLLIAEESLSAFQKAKRKFDRCCFQIHLNEIDRDYIEALEKCRPWVIRSSCDGRLWLLSSAPPRDIPMLFPTFNSALAYVKSEAMPIGWEIVQWEGPEQ